MLASSIRRFLAAIITVTLLIPVANAAVFSDVESTHPSFDAVGYVHENGVVSGYPDGNFRPDNPINRAEFTKILIEARFDDAVIDACDVSSLEFSDVIADAWFAPYVCIAARNDIIEGYADGTFRPGATVNFAEAAKIIVASDEGTMQSNPWYEVYVRSLADRGAVPIDIASPDAPLSRGNMAEVMYRVLAGIRSKPSQTYEQLITIAMMGDASAEQRVTQATFAGGCFWCMEPPYQEHPDVIDAVVGYAGGSAETASYDQVGRGLTEHREAVQVTYDPSDISYEELLEMFWRQIDPTDAGGQFADRGFQYTTAIYYHNDMQREVAERSKADLEASDKFDEPIATEILPYSTFFPAEDYHQEYYKKSADHYERYKRGSGRAGFIEENWAKDAALAHADEQEHSSYAMTEEERKAAREALDEESYDVIVNEGTEKPFENTYWDNKDEGIYVDKVSGEPLYSSTHKFKSGTGWPSFWRAIDDHFMVKKEDGKLFFKRTELRSKYGDSHLGHLFTDGPEDKTGLRHCINSASLRFVPKEKMQEEGYGKYVELFED